MENPRPGGACAGHHREVIWFDPAAARIPFGFRKLANAALDDRLGRNRALARTRRRIGRILRSPESAGNASACSEFVTITSKRLKGSPPAVKSASW
jgi:hypothetical protein